MKKLNRKTFITLFTILTVFLISILLAYNIQNYKREYNNIKRNLNFIEDNKKHFNDFANRPRDIDNMMIIDYEVYTVKISNNQVLDIISHSNSNDLDINTIANKIINNNTPNTLKIGNLYSSKYSYNYKDSTNLVIINTKDINNRLKSILISSVLLFIGFEIIIYFISNLITKWITKPAIEAFNKQKNFIADASHELKTPLAIIMASSDELNEDKKNTKYIENIKYESDRMNNLIASLLDLSKLEDGISISNKKDENISKIVEKTALTFEAIAYEKNISIATNIDTNVIFNCNKSEIEKLISIIIDNAIKHSYKDTTILVNMKRNKTNIDLEIINSGDPIKEEDREKIFERFYRVDKARNRKENRYGLGLAIAKSIVTNHNGIIKAYSKDNKTVFKIILKK